jgi:hypothetical protein
MAKRNQADPPPPSPQPPAGIECRKCGCTHWYVVWVDRRKDGRVVRRRACRHCGHQITTSERPIGEP